MSSFKSFLPYIILISLLVLGKFVLGKVSVPLSLGFNYSFNVFNPGFIFIIAGLFVIIIWKEKLKIIFNSTKILI